MPVLYPGCTLYISTTLVLKWTVKGLQMSSKSLINQHVSVLVGTFKYKEKAWSTLRLKKPCSTLHLCGEEEANV
jgi:hypothetical protein